MQGQAFPRAGRLRERSRGYMQTVCLFIGKQAAFRTGHLHSFKGYLSAIELCADRWTVPKMAGLIKVNKLITKHRSLYKRHNESVYCTKLLQRSRQAVRRERSTAKGGTLHRPWQTGSRMVTKF